MKLNGLNKKEIKDIINIVSEEIKKEENYPQENKVYSISLVEFYMSEYFKKTLKLCNLKQKIDIIKYPFNSLGFNINGEIYIFLSAQHKITK